MYPAAVSGGRNDTAAGPRGPAAGAPRQGRQVIPRPAEFSAGSAAPWGALDTPSRRGITLAAVRAALSRNAATAGAVERVAFDGFPDTGAPAAVLVALFEEAGEARVVLTRRAANLRTHTGEVSFPGGRLDQGETTESAAVREAREEIGLDPTSVELVGTLPVLSTMSSSATITPVLGLLPARPALVASPGEVERVFDVALAELVSDGVFREERWVFPRRGPPWWRRADHVVLRACRGHRVGRHRPHAGGTVAHRPQRVRAARGVCAPVTRPGTPRRRGPGAQRAGR